MLKNEGFMVFGFAGGHFDFDFFFVILNCFEIAFPDKGGGMGLLSQDCKVKCNITMA